MPTDTIALIAEGINPRFSSLFIRKQYILKANFLFYEPRRSQPNQENI